MKKNVEIVSCKSSGTVEEILVKEGSYVYEWEKLLSVKHEDRTITKLSVGISGTVIKVNVDEGLCIEPDTQLLEIEDDFLITGSD
ncbi:hypothetical protein [Virgibacillus ainsalahensis]